MKKFIAILTTACFACLGLIPIGHLAAQTNPPATDTGFITGTNTGVGKTVLAALLARFLRQSGLNVAAFKPACSAAPTAP